MEKYLRQLLSGIENSIAEAPSLPDFGWLPFHPDDDEDGDFRCTRHVRLCDLFGIIPEAFPPEHMLTDDQVSRLRQAIERLWKAWNLGWEMPLYLPERKQYAAMVREMGGEAISYDYERGGEVQICRFEEGGLCPFKPGDDYCFCKYIDDSVKHDIAIWEENVRAQGLDPYRELTPEEEAALEEEIRIRDLRKRYGDDWKKYYHPDDFYRYDGDDDWSNFFEDDFLPGFQGNWRTISRKTTGFSTPKTMTMTMRRYRFEV
jgi:hypothetical protein